METAYVVATASAPSTHSVKAHGADEVVDHTTTSVAEYVTKPVDVVLNLATLSEADMSALVGLVRPGGVLVSTASPATPDEARGVRARGMGLHPDAETLVRIVDGIDAGRLNVEVGATYPLSRTAAVHELSVNGGLRGKTLLVPGS